MQTGRRIDKTASPLPPTHTVSGLAQSRSQVLNRSIKLSQNPAKKDSGSATSWLNFIYGREALSRCMWITRAQKLWQRTQPTMFRRNILIRVITSFVIA